MEACHVVSDCNVWTEERKEMPQRWKEDGDGEPRIVKQLIGSRKATPALIGFLAATGVVQRTQRQQQEWRQKEMERDDA